MRQRERVRCAVVVGVEEDVSNRADGVTVRERRPEAIAFTLTKTLNVRAFIARSQR